MSNESKSLIDKVLESRKADVVVKVSVSGAIIRFTFSYGILSLSSVDAVIFSNSLEGLKDEFKVEASGKNSCDLYISSNYDVAQVAEIIATTCEEQQLSVMRILEGSGAVDSFIDFMG